MAFEFDSRNHKDLGSKKVSPFIEPIIAHKIYDSCRAQDCISVVAFAAEPVKLGEKHIKKGEIILVPQGAGKVDISGLHLTEANVISKRPSPFKSGFWDLEVKFVFEYTLTFKDCAHDTIIHVRAFSPYKRNYHLFGSVGSDTILSIDYAPHTGKALTTKGEPFSMVEATAIALDAEFRCNHRDLAPVDVAVTIGLFTTVQLFRIVGLDVESTGFHVPQECENHCPADPCEFFSSLDFPTDIFAPPQRDEFK